MQRRVKIALGGLVVVASGLVVARVVMKRPVAPVSTAPSASSSPIASATADAALTPKPEVCEASEPEDDIGDEEAPPALIRTLEASGAATIAARDSNSIRFDAGGSDGIVPGDVVVVETASTVIPFVVDQTYEDRASAKTELDASSIAIGTSVKLAARDCAPATPAATVVKSAAAGWLEVSQSEDDGVQTSPLMGEGPGPFMWNVRGLVEKQGVIAGGQLVLLMSSGKREIAKLQSVDDGASDKVLIQAMFHGDASSGDLLLERRTCTPRKNITSIPIPLASATLVSTKPFGNGKTLVTVTGPTRTNRTAQIVSPDGSVTPFTVQVVDAKGATGIVALSEDAVKKGVIETETVACKPPEKAPPWVKGFVSYVQRSADGANIEIPVLALDTDLGRRAHVRFEGETIDATVTRLVGRHAMVTIPNTNDRASRMCAKAIQVEVEHTVCKRVR